MRPLHLSGNGWKQVYEDHANTLANSLNTPKTGKLNDLFNRLTGIDKLSVSWSLGEIALDEFVSTRGDIAHQGRHADYVTIGILNSYRDNIRQYAVETDNAIGNYLKIASGRNYKPWNTTT